jgi:hypothetical protein
MIWSLYFHAKDFHAHWMRRWVGPRAGQNVVANRKISALARILTHVVHPTASHFIDRVIPVHK